MSLNVTWRRSCGVLLGCGLMGLIACEKSPSPPGSVSTDPPAVEKVVETKDAAGPTGNDSKDQAAAVPEATLVASAPDTTAPAPDPKPTAPADPAQAVDPKPVTDPPKETVAAAKEATASEQKKKPPVPSIFSGGPNLPGVKVVETVAPPDPLGKFTGLDNAFGGSVSWAAVLTKLNKDIQSTDFTDLKFTVPLLTGVRICDGVMAVKTKNAEVLQICASDIEDFGRRLGVSEEDLKFATMIRDKAKKEEWFEVYTNLSQLQQRVQKTMKASSPLTAALVMVGGWMQGARYVSEGVAMLGSSAGGRTHPSYFLREPRMVAWMAGQIESHRLLDPSHAKDLTALHKDLMEICNLVNLDSDPSKGKMSSADLARLQLLTGGIIQRALQNTTAAAPALAK